MIRLLARLIRNERFIPIAGSVAAALLLIAGLTIISQNEQTYRADQARESHVQAEILAASVVAALDFGDRQAAQEAVDALRVNPRVQAAGVYASDGALMAGYRRSGQALPPSPASLTPPASNSLQLLLPVERSSTRIGTVYLSTAVEPLSRRMTRYALVGLLFFMTALLLAVIGVAHRSMRRANRELEQQAASLAEANHELQVQMEERSRAEENLRQAQKMQSLGQLTGGIAHDFNNMLTVIQGSADILRRPQISEEKRVRFASAVAETANRAAALTSQLLAFARRQSLAPVPLDLNARIRGMLPLLEPLLGASIAIKLDLGSGLHAIEADPSQLEAAILNVMVNARDAMPEGGAVTIRTRHVTGTESGQLQRAVELSVTDTGPGVDKELRDRVFEPFFTTKSVGKGTGLGLSQVYGFVNQTGGEVRIEGGADEGARIAMLFPPSNHEPEAAADAAPGQQQRTTGRVLLVEDNPQVGAFAETLLEELGHEVLRAMDGHEALLLTDEGATFDIVFSDVVMPGMNGLELANELRQRRPNIPIILTTGYSDRIASAGAQGHNVIAKPYRLETIADAIEKALSNRQAA